jgi:putative ABC transport system permease protein
MRFFRRKNEDEAMDAEMRFHVDMEAAELERMGVAPAEARRRALAAFGGVQRYKEEGHEARGGSWLEDLARDVRYSLRSLRRSPGYTAVVILTLALGIAANASIFSVANGILFKPLPYRDPSRLMVIWDGLDWIGVPEAWITGPEVVRLRREAKTFEGFSVLRSGSATIGASDGSEPQQARQSGVSANFFQLLGTGPDIGRGFAAGEDLPGAARVVVLSRSLWKQRFGGDSSLVGKTIILDGQATTVVGILPSAFRFSAQSSLGSPSDADVIVPLVDTLAAMNPDSHSLGLLARVRSGMSVADARAELDAISKRLDAELYRPHRSPKISQGFHFVPVMLQERMVRDVRPALVALLAAVGVLILIMCANLAVLALVRAARRERELTVRRAIGAGHGRITRQILTETVLLSLGSAVVGAVLGTWALRGLLAIAPAGLPRREEIGIDLAVLGVTLLVALVVGIGMGLAPVFHSVRSDIASVLREKAPSRTGSKVRHMLVLAQLALSMVLLAGTGLLLGSFVRLMRVDAGFSADNVLTIELMATRGRYATGQPVVDLFTRYANVLRAMPGVTAVGVTSAPPLSAGADQSGVFFPSSPTNTGDPQHDRMLGDVAPAGAGYFTAMGIPLLGGREFEAGDRDSTAKVAVIDDIVAHRYFPKGNAVGQIVRIDGDSLRVVGIARHVRMYSLQDEGRGQAYVPHGYRQYRYMIVAVRTTGDPLSFAAAARRAIRSVDAEQPIISMATMAESVRGSMAERRLVLTLVSAFAAAALLLVALGVYGVTSNTVTQRTRELGIRMALGADRRTVVWSVLGEPARLVTAGLILGLGATLAAGRVVQKLLYDVSPTDPLTLAVVAVLLLLVALLASYFPARRATRVDPMVALRAD